ncbi:Lactosylceramide 4-alpha-galactosyltransferase [Linum grandiflorum]
MRKVIDRAKPLFLFSLVLIIFVIRTSLIPTVVVVLPIQSSSPSLIIKSSDKTVTRRIIKSDDDEEDREDENGVHYLVPPFNLTAQERIQWFRKNLQNFQILKSDNLTSRFQNRIREFVDRGGCGGGDGDRLLFFMTWISPAGSFGAREFLAVESLFKSNPDGCLVILSRSLDSGKGRRILRPLLDRGFRATAMSPDLDHLFRGTPAESWFEDLKRGEKDPGEIPLAQNLSNLIRLAVLYKYGGVYLDTDVIVLKSFRGLRNSIGAQSSDVVTNKWTRLNNAVLVFDRDHPLLYEFMAEFAATFDGSRWGHNGPYLVSRVVDRYSAGGGGNFSILPPLAFYPAYWNKIGGYFRAARTKADSRWVNAKLLQLSGRTYAVHLWNKESRGFRIEEGSILWSLIARHCIICQGFS